LKTTQTFLLRPASLLFVPLSIGCGFSQNVNDQVAAEEQKLQAEACRQIIQHSDLIVERARQVLPSADQVIQVPLPSSQCTVAFTQSDARIALDLSTPNCPIVIPDAPQGLALSLSLGQLSFLAQKNGSGVVTLSGTGSLDLSAKLPVFGDYAGKAAYRLERSSVNTQQGTVDLHMVLTYRSGQNQTEILLDVTGARDSIYGTVSGPSLRCEVRGALESPRITCQQPTAAARPAG
jgi:hypothetical protein